MAKMSEGYCGQDAYSDMFVTEKRNGLLHRKWSVDAIETVPNGRGVELYARSASTPHRGGVLN